MRRTSLNDLSSRMVNYLLERRGLSSTQIAQITGVDKSFISRVKSAQREFSIDHLERIADHIGVELGVLLIDASGPARTTDPRKLKLIAMCEEFIHQADALTARIKQKTKEQKPKSNAA